MQHTFPEPGSNPTVRFYRKKKEKKKEGDVGGLKGGDVVVYVNNSIPCHYRREWQASGTDEERTAAAMTINLLLYSAFDQYGRLL